MFTLGVISFSSIIDPLMLIFLILPFLCIVLFLYSIILHFKNKSNPQQNKTIKNENNNPNNSQASSTNNSEINIFDIIKIVTILVVSAYFILLLINSK